MRSGFGVSLTKREIRREKSNDIEINFVRWPIGTKNQNLCRRELCALSYGFIKFSLYYVIIIDM